MNVIMRLVLCSIESVVRVGDDVGHKPPRFIGRYFTEHNLCVYYI